MCGLCGYITHQDAKLSLPKLQQRNRIFNALMLTMQERGNESTGVAFVDKGQSQIIKAPVTSDKFITLPKYHSFLTKNYPLALGHTRQATTGEVSKRNAHPFRRENIIGTHNGYVWNWRDFEKDDDINVDSEAIFKQLAIHKNDYKKVFPTLRGQFALAWTQLKQDSYNVFLAVDGNPLHTCYLPDLKTMFWCSTLEPLKLILTSQYFNFDIEVMNEGFCLELDSKLNEKSSKIEFGKFADYSHGSYNYSSHTYESNRYQPEDYKCKKCFKEYINCDCPVEDDSNFCSYCGTDISSRKKVYVMENDIEDGYYCRKCKRILTKQGSAFISASVSVA